MKKYLKNKKGYTLIEVLLSITIFSIAIVMITNFYLNFLKFHNEIESKSLINTNIVSTINSIKYRIDDAKRLEILTKQEVLEMGKLGSEYKYIYLENGNIVTGKMDGTKYSKILNKSEHKNSNINLSFENKNNGLNIKMTITDENGFNIAEPINSFILLSNMKNNNISIKGTNGNAIIYKSDEK